MPTDQERDHVVDAIHKSYQVVVDQTPITDPVWPPAASIIGVDSVRGRRAWSGWKAATAGFLLTVAFGIGWVVAPSPQATANDPFDIELGMDTATAVVIPDDATALFPNPFDAAIAAAIAQESNLNAPHVTKLVGIYADELVVDFRVQVQADGFCHWYGVVGRVNNGVLEWQAGPALDCDGQ